MRPLAIELAAIIVLGLGMAHSLVAAELPISSAAAAASTATLASSAALPWAAAPPAASAAEIAALIRDLGDDKFSIREAAEERLTALYGPTTRAAIETATKSDDPEISQRAQRILLRGPSVAQLSPEKSKEVIRLLDEEGRTGGKSKNGGVLDALSTRQMQALLWNFLVKIPEMPDPRFNKCVSVFRVDEDWQRLQGALSALERRMAQGDVLEVLADCLRHEDVQVRQRAAEMISSIAFRQQGPMRLDPKLAPFLDLAIKAACSPGSDEERVQALKTLEKFHDHLTPQVHKLAKLLDDPSKEVRRAAALTMRVCGPAAARYVEKMLAPYDIAGSVEDANQAAWIMQDMYWSPVKEGVQVIEQMSQTKGEPDPLDYAIPRLLPSPKVIAAMLKVPPRLMHSEYAYWVANNAAGDRRFIPGLLEAMRLDWVREHERDPRRDPADETCFNTPYLAKALAAVGHGDKELAAALAKELDNPLPTAARLYVGFVLSRITDDPKPLVDAMVRIFEEHKEKVGTYTQYHMLDLAGEVDPSQAARLMPYHEQFLAIIKDINQGNPTGYFLLTGETEPLLDWLHRDLEKTRGNGCSDYLMFAAPTIGPVAAPQTEELIELLGAASDWPRSEICVALATIGPTDLTRGQTKNLRELSDKFKPQDSANAALAIWSCAHETEKALAILTPLLDDKSFGTTRSSWILGQMGRDGKAALPQLKKLVEGPNPAYAYWAKEAVALIEAELARKVEPKELCDELESDDYLVSLRALWRLVDLGPPAAKTIRERMEHDDKPQLPGRKIRQQARFRQVLDLIDAAEKK